MNLLLYILLNISCLSYKIIFVWSQATAEAKASVGQSIVNNIDERLLKLNNFLKNDPFSVARPGNLLSLPLNYQVNRAECERLFPELLLKAPEVIVPVAAAPIVPVAAAPAVPPAKTTKGIKRAKRPTAVPRSRKTTPGTFPNGPGGSTPKGPLWNGPGLLGSVLSPMVTNLGNFGENMNMKDTPLSTFCYIRAPLNMVNGLLEQLTEQIKALKNSTNNKKRATAKSKNDSPPPLDQTEPVDQNDSLEQNEPVDQNGPVDQNDAFEQNVPVDLNEHVEKNDPLVPDDCDCSQIGGDAAVNMQTIRVLESVTVTLRHVLNMLNSVLIIPAGGLCKEDLGDLAGMGKRLGELLRPVSQVLG